MKLFGRTGGYWIFWVSVVYCIVGLVGIANGTPLTFLPPLYIMFLSLPFIVPPLGRWLNMNVDWDLKMFDWFKGRSAKEYLDEAKETSNVVKFPEPEAVPPMPEVEPPKQEAGKTYYRLGITDNNRVSFQLGYSEVTMNREGIDNMIKQLTFFRDQLYNGDEE